MARFYDSLDSRELARVEQILTRGGIEYTVISGAAGSPVNEIEVAAEDVAHADSLLARHGGGVH